MGLGQRLTHSIASAIDFTCQSQKPAISSFASVNGPSIMVRFAPENLTRAPFELGWSPSIASTRPAFASSSLYFPISLSNFSPEERPQRGPAGSTRLSIFLHQLPEPGELPERRPARVELQERDAGAGGEGEKLVQDIDRGIRLTDHRVDRRQYFLEERPVERVARHRRDIGRQPRLPHRLLLPSQAGERHPEGR